MRYISTRGMAPVLNFSDVLLEGLGKDGGLYVPDVWPQLSDSANGDYLKTAVETMSPFLGSSIPKEVFEEIVVDAYSSFRNEEITPLVDMGQGLHLLELFHGPTLAFKDIALQLVGRLFDYELKKQNKRVTIVGATSGDTGSAAIEACRDKENIEMIILHPAGRVSEIQRRQMTTVKAKNIHNVAIEGTFDDCQDLVKGMFADHDFRHRIHLSAINSINWARVMAQIVYFVVAAERLGGRKSPIAFSVPTGNFGNVFSGYVARMSGLNINQLVVGSNTNDILTQFFNTGTMNINEVIPTTSPSMDIQVSSNLERLLFDLLNRDGRKVEELLKNFREEKTVSIAPELHEMLRNEWNGACFTDEEVKRCISEEADRSGIVLDPHSAVGVLAARECRKDKSIPMVALATAHPAKFPDAVEDATGIRPELPSHLADLLDRPEQYVQQPNDLEIVQSHIEEVVG
ncbi:MAG TPA: threonine synthase [Acidimicrobiales bacterium]|nr:threonine synthase [Acidimicrobiales bacterium]